MSANAVVTTENLLEQAARDNDSSTGGASSVSRATRAYPNEAAADKAFTRFHNKLFRVKRWNDCSDISSFALFDKNGDSQPEKKAAAGDYIKITLPGSGKADWVEISKINEMPDEVILIIRPSRDPTDWENAAVVSHFFDADSTNNFCLQKNKAAINFYVIGLREKTNTQSTGGIVETARNFMTANIGYYFGIQAAQWQIFCDNFLETEKN